MIALWIDDVDARAAYGFTLERSPGWADAAPRTTATAAIPGRPGAVALATPAEGPRKLVLTGTVIGLTASDARAKLDLLHAAVGGRSTARLRTGDRPGRELVASLESLTVATPGAQHLATSLPVEITFVANAPYWRDTADTVVSGIGPIGAAADKALPQGTAPSRPMVVVSGVGVTPVTVTLLDSGGNAVAEMAFDPAGAGLPGQAALWIDCDACRAWYNFLSVTANALPYLDPDSDFVVVDAGLYGDYASGAWPRLAASAGTGCTATYRKQWR